MFKILSCKNKMTVDDLFTSIRSTSTFHSLNKDKDNIDIDNSSKIIRSINYLSMMQYTIEKKSDLISSSLLQDINANINCSTKELLNIFNKLDINNADDLANYLFNIYKVLNTNPQIEPTDTYLQLGREFTMYQIRNNWLNNKLLAKQITPYNKICKYMWTKSLHYRLSKILVSYKNDPLVVLDISDKMKLLQYNMDNYSIHSDSKVLDIIKQYINNTIKFE
jgi:hypothetical protein